MGAERRAAPPARTRGCSFYNLDIRSIVSMILVPNEAGRHTRRSGNLRHDAVLNRPGEIGVVVIGEADEIVDRERTSRQIVRHSRIEAAVASVELRLAVAHGVEGRSDPGGPVVVQRQLLLKAGLLLLLVPQTGIDRQPVADLPRVLDEEIDVVLSRRYSGGGGRARDPVNLPEVRVRQDRDRRPLAVIWPLGRRKVAPRTARLRSPRGRIEAVFELMPPDDVGRFHGELVIQAVVARLKETDATSCDQAASPYGL